MSHLTEEILIEVPTKVVATYLSFIIVIVMLTVLVYALLHIWKYDLWPDIKRWFIWRRLSKGVKKK